MWCDRNHGRLLLIGLLWLGSWNQPQTAHGRWFHRCCGTTRLSCGGGQFVCGRQIHTKRTRCAAGGIAPQPSPDSPDGGVTILGTLPVVLQLQQAVNADTLRLAAIVEPQPGRNLDSELTRLSKRQRQIAIPLDALIQRLRREGTSAAFPAVLEQIRSDVHEAADRLEHHNPGSVTQAIQLDILESLEEILAIFR